MLAELIDRARPDVNLLHFLDPIVTANTVAELKAATGRALRGILPCEHYLFALGERRGSEVYILDCIHTTPTDCLHAFVDRNGGVPPTKPELMDSVGVPRLTWTDRLSDPIDRQWAEILLRQRIYNVAWTLFPGVAANTFIGYFFYNIAPAVAHESKLRIAMLAPHIHIALTRTLRNERRWADAAGEHPFCPLAALSAREVEVARWVACGKTNLEIGRILKISDKTVKTHVQNILFKLELANRSQIAAHFASAQRLAAIAG